MMYSAIFVMLDTTISEGTQHKHLPANGHLSGEVFSLRAYASHCDCVPLSYALLFLDVLRLHLHRRIQVHPGRIRYLPPHSPHRDHSEAIQQIKNKIEAKALAPVNEHLEFEFTRSKWKLLLRKV